MDLKVGRQAASGEAPVNLAKSSSDNRTQTFDAGTR